MGFTLKQLLSAVTIWHGRYPDVESVRSFDELLHDTEIDLVIINTPDHTHAELAHKALMAGKHVVVEKPFTLHAGEGEDLLNLATRKSKIISVFQNRRWDGDFLTIQKVINEGLVGELVNFESNFDRFRNYIQPNSWKEDSSNGTGTIYNLGSHLIDQALVLFGLPEAVTAELRTLRPEGMVDDFFEVLLHYTGMRVALKASYLAREAGARFSLHGTQGSFVKYGLDPQENALKAGHSPQSTDWGKEKPEMWGTLNTEKHGLHYVGKLETIAGNYMAFYDNIYDAIINGKELAVKPEEAINVISIIEAALESYKLKRTISL